MATLTIHIDPETLDRVEKRAAEQGTSVGEIVATYLDQYGASAVREQDEAKRPSPSGDGAGESVHRERAEAFDRLFEMARNSRAGSGPDGRTWTRDDIYDDAILRRR